MKTVVLIVLLFVGFFVAVGSGSYYIMGGIEAGLPDGGNGKFSDYHEGNQVTSFFRGESDSGASGSDFDPGDVSANPFVK